MDEAVTTDTGTLGIGITARYRKFVLVVVGFGLQSIIQVEELSEHLIVELLLGHLISILVYIKPCVVEERWVKVW